MKKRCLNSGLILKMDLGNTGNPKRHFSEREEIYFRVRQVSWINEKIFWEDTEVLCSNYTGNQIVLINKIITDEFGNKTDMEIGSPIDMIFCGLGPTYIYAGKMTMLYIPWVHEPSLSKGYYEANFSMSYTVNGTAVSGSTKIPFTIY